MGRNRLAFSLFSPNFFLLEAEKCCFCRVESTREMLSTPQMWQKTYKVMFFCSLGAKIGIQVKALTLFFSPWFFPDHNLGWRTLFVTNFLKLDRSEKRSQSRKRESPLPISPPPLLVPIPVFLSPVQSSFFIGFVHNFIHKGTIWNSRLNGGHTRDKPWKMFHLHYTEY